MIGHVRLSRTVRLAGSSRHRIFARHSTECRQSFWTSTFCFVGRFALGEVLSYHRNRPNLQLTLRLSKGTWDEPGIFGSFRGNGAADGRL
jgi:hypothetical protein